MSLENLAQMESSLWEAADQLRANSKLTSSEYCMPVLGVIFLRHATNRDLLSLDDEQRRAVEAAAERTYRHIWQQSTSGLFPKQKVA